MEVADTVPSPELL